MISRRYLREAELIRTVKNCYPLFIWLFSIFPELTYYRSNKLEDLKGKHIPTQEDLNPNTKFVDNKVIAQIEQNVTLRKLIPQYRINWSEDTDFIVKLFHAIEELDEYKKYMSTREGTYEEDKKLVLDIIQNIFIEDEHMRWFFGEKDVNWLDDYDEALMMLYMNISDFKQAKGDDCKILTLFKNTREDERFCRQLFVKTLENDTEYEKMIESKLQNWELERVIGMDMLLMKMAICELTEFPDIPVKVTLNEYIDLAKYYSSDKSKIFVNGILDKIIVDLRDQGKLKKAGRGLYQN